MKNIIIELYKLEVYVTGIEFWSLVAMSCNTHHHLCPVTRLLVYSSTKESL